MPKITIRISKQEYKDIKEAAEKNHLRIATFCRKMILDNLPDKLPSFR